MGLKEIVAGAGKYAAGATAGIILSASAQGMSCRFDTIFVEGRLSDKLSKLPNIGDRLGIFEVVSKILDPRPLGYFSGVGDYKNQDGQADDYTHRVMDAVRKKYPNTNESDVYQIIKGEMFARIAGNFNDPNYITIQTLLGDAGLLGKSYLSSSASDESKRAFIAYAFSRMATQNGQFLTPRSPERDRVLFGILEALLLSSCGNYFEVKPIADEKVLAEKIKEDALSNIGIDYNNIDFRSLFPKYVTALQDPKCTDEDLDKIFEEEVKPHIYFKENPLDFLKRILNYDMGWTEQDQQVDLVGQGKDYARKVLDPYSRDKPWYDEMVNDIAAEFGKSFGKIRNPVIRQKLFDELMNDPATKGKLGKQIKMAEDKINEKKNEFFGDINQSEFFGIKYMKVLWKCVPKKYRKEAENFDIDKILIEQLKTGMEIEKKAVRFLGLLEPGEPITPDNIFAIGTSAGKLMYFYMS